MGNIVQDVLATVTRDIGGVSTAITTDSTDSSGLVTLFLNPDFNYDYVFSKTGFVDNPFTLRPSSTDIYNVVMATADAGINGTELGLNTTYLITPTNSTLNNNTLYTFGFNVSSAQPITSISMNITANGTQLDAATLSSAGFISVDINTDNQTRIIGYYTIESDDEIFTFTKIWTVGEEFIGDYSIFRQFKLFNDYGFSDLIRILLIIATITGIMIFLSAGELIETSESKILVSILMLWAFSIVGWLDTGLVTTSAAPNADAISKFGSQYGIAMVSSAVASFFILRRVFIRRI